MSFDSYSVQELLDSGDLELVQDGNHGGNYPKVSEFVDAGIPLITGACIDNGLINFGKASFLTKDRAEKLRIGFAKTGDILLSHKGTMGKTAIVPELSTDFIILNPQLTLYRVSVEGRVRSRYLKYYFDSKIFQSFMERISATSTINTLPITEQRKMEIPVPPLEVQDLIVKVAGSIDDKIQLNRETNQTLEQISRAMFKSWFVDFEPVKAKIQAKQNGQDPERAAMCAISGKSLEELEQLGPETQQQFKTTVALFPNALVESELGEMPEGWSVGIIGDLFELHRGFDLPKNDRKDGPYPVYAAGGYHGQHAEFKMEPPGIITGRSGVIGNVYLSLTKYWPLNTTLYVREFKRCKTYYAYFFLNMCDLKALNSGSAVPSLNRNFVHSMNCLIPDGSLLDVFEEYASSSFVKIKSNDSEVELLSSIRDFLLPKLLSGDISLNNFNQNMEVAANG